MDRKLRIPSKKAPYADCAAEIAYPQGLKWTRQRKSVYKVLWEAKEPLTAIQIYQRVSASAGEDSREYAVSTIYRILAAFEEKDLVEKDRGMEDGSVSYSLNRGGHTHYAVCLKCHNKIPLRDCPFSHIHLEKDMEDFTVTGHKLELYGYCRNCGARPGI